MACAPAQIDETQITEYERAGAICLRGLFDDQWVGRLREAIERRIRAGAQTHSKRADAYSFTELFMWRTDQDFRDFVFESPAAAIAARMMRSQTVRFYFDQIFNKEPGMLAPSAWHNDQPFYPIAGAQVCSIWLALDPVTKQSSGLEYVAGSHRWPQVARGEVPDIGAIIGRCEMLNWDMQPGDCLVHHGLTVHGAGGNTTLGVRRRALATRWIGDDVVYRDRAGGHEQLKARGLQTGEPLPAGQFPTVAFQDTA